MSLKLFRRTQAVGLDLGHHAIRVVDLQRTQSGWQFNKLGWTRTPADAIKDGVVIDPESVGFAIKHLLRETHVSANSVHIAVAGGSVVVRNVRMPLMPEGTLRKSIQFEAGRYVPSSIEDSYIEFEILGRTAENQMDVLIVAAPKEIVESRVAACRLAGLETESVDVEVFAAYRSLIEANTEHDTRDKTIALVDIGSATTHISVVQRGNFAMTRTIGQGGGVLTEALKTYFKLDDENAEAGKAALDLTELMDDTRPKENPPLRVLQPHVDDLIREIRRSLNYFQSQQTEGADNKTIDRILLTGGGSRLAQLASYVGHKLGIQTATVGLFDNPRFLRPDAGDDPGCEWSVACGLAMRSHARAKPKAA